MTETPSGSSPSPCWPAPGRATTGCPERPRRTHVHPDPRFRNVLLACVLTLWPAAGLCDGVAGDAVRPPCDPSDRREVGHEGDDGGRTVECAPVRAARLPRPA